MTLIHSTTEASITTTELTVLGKATVEDAVTAGHIDVLGILKAGSVRQNTAFKVDGKATINSLQQITEQDTTDAPERDTPPNRIVINGDLITHNIFNNDEIEINGTAEIHDTLNSSDVHVDGALTLQNSLSCDHLNIKGSAKIQGTTDSSTLTLQGEGVFDTLNCDELTGSGQLTAEQLSTTTTDFTPTDISRVDTLTGGRITIHTPSDNPQSQPKGHLKCTQIRGTTVILEATTAETIIADSVTLHEDSSATTVYTNNLTTTANATVDATYPLQDAPTR